MKKVGWIKLYRKELEWMESLSDQEFRYYITSRCIVVWDKRHKSFGTFDARTKTVKAEMLPRWSVGKINQVKNSLLKKGLYQKVRDFRLKIINADIFLGKSRKCESIVQDSENNLHITENYIQDVESIARGMRVTQKHNPKSFPTPWRK